MKVKLTASCVWTPQDNHYDRQLVKTLLKDQPEDVVIDYLVDALAGSEDMSYPKVSVEEV